MQVTYEQLELVSYPEQTAGALVFHAKTSQSPVSKKDSLPESVVLCFLQLQGLLETSKKKIDPAYLLIENVKNLLSINRGKLDFLKLQIELDEIGYDVEWDVLDSAEVVPQHRERIFIVGHLRGRRTRKSISYRQKKRRN